MRASERASRILDATGLAVLAARVPRGSVLVLDYHRIGTPPGDGADESWSATAEDLHAQLEFLTRHFEVIAPSEIPAALDGRCGRFAAVTFDDGYRDSHDVALPILSELGIPAAFFVCTGFLDRGGTAWWDEIATLMSSDPGAAAAAIEHYKSLPADQAERFLRRLRARANGHDRPASPRWLTWPQVRRLHAAGMEIGGHTVTHPILSRLSAGEQRHQIAECARRLEEMLGEPMRLFAYPVGRPESFDATTQALLRQEGVELAFSCYGGLASRRDWNPLDARRIPIGRTVSPSRFRALAAMPSVFGRV